LSVARDFDDQAREYGGDSVRAALDAAQWVGRETAPYPEAEVERPQFTAMPFTWRDPATIPRRQFLYGFELRRRQLSAVVAPGAAGKTTLKVGRAICMALGRDLLGHRVWNGPHRVWLWNLEDDLEEVEKTVHAFLKLWDLDPRDLGDRLLINGSDTTGAGALKLAVEDKVGGFTIQRPVSEALIDEIKRLEIDYLDIDPFVSSHSVDENSNPAIDAVAKEWLRIAQQCNCAVSLAHHVRKSGVHETTAHDARGAGSMIDAARSTLVLQRMSKETAQEYRIAECDRRKYFSVFDDKNNKAPAASQAEWYQFIGVGLGNGDDTGPEDSIGAIQRWQAPDAFGGVSVRQLYNIQSQIDQRPAESRKHPKSRAWVGKLVSHVLGTSLDEEGESRRIEKMLGTWCATGALKTVERQNEKREMVEYVEVGAWAILE